MSRKRAYNRKTGRSEWAGGAPPRRPELGEGWGRTVIMRHQHYVRHGHALCGKWVYTGPVTPKPEANIEKCHGCAALCPKAAL